jgi:hypothetical protein
MKDNSGVGVKVGSILRKVAGVVASRAEQPAKTNNVIAKATQPQPWRISLEATRNTNMEETSATI